MGKQIDDGGPAFPVPIAATNSAVVPLASSQQPGMSLRDYFAAWAMQAILDGPRIGGVARAAEETAAAAYMMADAMIAARQS